MKTSRRHFLAAVAAGATARVASGQRLDVPGGSIPLVGAYDLVVAGGSTTGVAAAVTAARAGLSVAIVEYNAFFGGTATNRVSLVTPDGHVRHLPLMSKLAVARRIVAFAERIASDG